MTLTVGMCPKWGALSFSVTSKVYSLLVQAKRCYKTLYISDLTDLQVCNETHTKPNGQLKIRPQALLLKEKSVETIFEDLFLLIYT